MQIAQSQVNLSSYSLSLTSLTPFEFLQQHRILLGFNSFAVQCCISDKCSALTPSKQLWWPWCWSITRTFLFVIVAACGRLDTLVTGILLVLITRSYVWTLVTACNLSVNLFLDTHGLNVASGIQWCKRWNSAWQQAVDISSMSSPPSAGFALSVVELVSSAISEMFLYTAGIWIRSAVWLTC